MKTVQICVSQRILLRRMFVGLTIVCMVAMWGGHALRGQETTINTNPESAVEAKMQQLPGTPWAEIMNEVQAAAQDGDHEKWIARAQASLVEVTKLPQALQGVAAVISNSMIGEYYLAVGEGPKAEEKFQEARQLAEAAGALPEDAMMLQIGLRLYQLYQQSERAEDSLALLEQGWKSLQKAQAPLPRHVIAYGSALIHNLVADQEFGKAKRVADRLDARITSMELDSLLEVGAKSSIVIAWSKAGKGEQALNHMRRINHLSETEELQPWAVELTLHAGIAYGQSVKDMEITSHFERSLQQLQQQMSSPLDNETDARLGEISPSGSPEHRLHADNRREMLMLELDQIDSELQFAEQQLAQINAQVEADYAAYRATRDYAIQNGGRIAALTGIPGTLVPHQQDMYLQMEQQQLNSQVQSLRIRKSQIEQLLRGR
jgi:hypothetical protein